MTTYSFDYCSDLHIEFDLDYDQPIPTERLLANQRSDNLIIAGDFCVIDPTDKYSVEYTMQEMQPFIDAVTTRYNRVYVVLGNHDHWYHSIDDAWLFYSQMFPTFTILDSHCNIVSVFDDNLQIVGSTLWSNIEPRYFSKAERFMNDYRFINDGDALVTAEQTTDICNKTFKQLFDVVSDSDRKSLVITHHVPVDSTKTFPAKSCPEAYFSFTYDRSIEMISDRLVGWVHGHVHAVNKYNRCGVNMYCNPRGYINSTTDENFKLRQLQFEI